VGSTHRKEVPVANKKKDKKGKKDK